MTTIDQKLISLLIRLSLTLLSVAILVSCASPNSNAVSAVEQLENVKSQMLLRDFRSAGKFYHSDKFDQLSRSTLQRLYPGRHTNYQVRLARLPEYNAFALPNGVIVLHLGLLALLENEDQLAFVLAHEIAHIDARDSYTSAHYRRQSRIKAQLVDILSFGSGASFGHYASQLRTASRRQEMAADSAAAQVVHQAGYDLSAAVTFFNLLQVATAHDGRPQGDSTHPAYVKRRDQIVSFQSHHATKQHSVPGQLAVVDSVNGFNALRLSVLPKSIEDKLEELDYLNALQQIDTLISLGADADLILCLRGKAFSGIAENGPMSFVYAMNERYIQGLEEHAIVPQVYDEGTEKKYFHARALGEFLTVLNQSAAYRSAQPQQVNSIGISAESMNIHTCAIRGAGLSSHALGQSTLAAHYFRQYLQIAPAAMDTRYIESLQRTRSEL